MKRITCPYLGLKDDPTTALNFPSPGNFCHQARPVAPVKGSYQEKYCLTEEHAVCPLYQAAHPVMLPTMVSAKPASIINRRQVIAVLGIPALVAGVAALVYAWPMVSAMLFSSGTIPNTGTISGDENAILLDAPQDTRTAFPPLQDNAAPQKLTTACPKPTNWVTYTVNPTDSLFRLSVIYGVSVEDLQKANCMGSKTAILPGQVISVPFIPTNTPISTDTGTVEATAPRVIFPLLPIPTNPPVANSTTAPSPSVTAQPPIASVTPEPSSTTTPQPTGTPVPPTATSIPTGTTQPSATATNPPPPTATNPPPPTATRIPLPTATNPPPPTATVIPLPTATDVPLPTATDIPLPTATDIPLPTATNPPPPTATDVPLPTATNPPPPTATDVPLSTATNPPPPPTATNPPPPPTATNPPPPPTATNPPPPPTATNPPPPPPPTATNPPPPTATP